MLLSVHSHNRRHGLQTLIAADDVVVAPGGRNVTTRTIAASRRAVCGDRDPDPFVDDDEEVEEEGGRWEMYGWRRRLRRLPPLIPSLRRAGSSPWALTRTRTADGRVVVTRDPAPQRGRVVARRLDGRLILDLVDSSPVPPPPRKRLPAAHPSTPIAQVTDAPATTDDEEEEEASGADIESARGRDVPAALRASIVASSSPVGSAAASPVPAVACFEAVIRMSPLSKMPIMSLPRMVH